MRYMGLNSPEFEVRVPEDSEDFESRLRRTVRGPQEFKVTRGNDLNSPAYIQVWDWDQVRTRKQVSSYKVYFCPYSISNFQYARVGARTNILGAMKMGRLVAEFQAQGDGSLLVEANNTLSGLQGWYYCVAVNALGVESQPNGPVPSPWN